MCRSCVKEEHPDRGHLCSESGAYLLNLECCAGCGCKDRLQSHGRQETTDQEGRETITFQHMCGECGHVVAVHEHEFWVEGGYQEYGMSCLLCGLGEDTRSVFPQDPSAGASLF